jgi:hypothetical protein
MGIWPNFFIVGAPRAGTTSLYEYLKNCENVFMSPIKETYFFSPNVNMKLILSKPVKNQKDYQKLFHNVKTEKAIGEATPSYLWDPDSAKLIHEKIPNARIIIILRNPINRAFSHYLWLVSLGKENLSFSEAIKKSLSAKPDFSGRIIDGGMYSNQIQRYLDEFDQKQIKIIIFEEFLKNPKLIVEDILKFLDIDSNPPEIFEAFNSYVEPRGKLAKSMIQNKFLQKLGTSLPQTIASQATKILDKKAVKPKMSESNMKMLKNIYSEDVKNLKSILNKDFLWNF